MLSVEELPKLEDDVMSVLPGKIEEILSRTNRTGQLEILLDLMDMEDLLHKPNQFESDKNGKIVVVGSTEVKEKDLLSIGKSLGLAKDRFEFCLDYESIQKYNFRKMQYAPQYRLILCGPMPHSGTGKEDSSSIISNIENKEGYPPVVRLMSGHELKITKSNFRARLLELQKDGYV